jgi:chlorobactene glucosyltransferase
VNLLALYIDIFPYTVAGFIILLLAIGTINSLSIKRFDQFPPTNALPRVSILVPARNEANNIEGCLVSLLAQDYPDFDVFALDDHSTDDTASVLARLEYRDPRLRVLSGKALPAGWLGKHWACHQLAQAATGELILFTDADTLHTPDMLRVGVSALLAENADMVTAIPHEQAETWGELLVIPAAGMFVLCFLPLAFAQRFGLPSFAFAIGQFMLFRRASFEAAGGYGSVRDNIVDDVALARRIVREGFRWRIMDGTRHASCRMYRGFRDAVDGFTKNIFAYFNHRLLLFAVAWAWIEVAFILPPLAALVHAFGMPVDFFPPELAFFTTVAAWACWWLACRRFGFPLSLSFIYPILLTLFVMIAFRSMVINLTGRAHWKGREVSRVLWRW